MNKIIAVLFLAVCSVLHSQWIQLGSNTSADLKSVFFLNISTGYVSGASGTMLKTTNGGLNWDSQVTGISENINSVYFLTPQTGYACANNGKIIYTSSGGSNWLTSQSNVTDNLLSVSGNFCSGSEGTLLYTTNGGLNWVVASGGFFSTNYYGINSLSASIAIACGVNAIFQPLIARTTNGGVNWSYSTFYLNSNEGNLRDVIFLNSNNVLCVSNVWDGTGGISRSVNGGVNWTTQIFPSALNSIDMAGAFGFAAGHQGYVLKTIDSGLVWQQSQTGLNTIFRSADIIDELNAYICGDGGVIIKTTNGGVTPVQSITSDIPANFSLSQNYPNPFNPSTTINFSIPSVETTRRVVSLKVYNISGREIATLVNQQLTPGTYSETWDASNFPSGMYFYKLTYGSFSETKKMILIK